MKAILFLSLLSIATGQIYFSFRDGADGPAISLGNGGTRAYLRFVPYDPLDTHQHFFFQSAGGDEYFVVSRAFPYLVFDVTGYWSGGSWRHGYLAAWERKSGQSASNQRFTFEPVNNFLFFQDEYSYVSTAGDDLVGLSSRTQSSAGLLRVAAPALYTVRVIGNNQLINITFTNSRRNPNWIIPANASFSEKQILSGTILKATDSAGVILAPTLFTVTRNATISFYISNGTEPPTPTPTPAPSSICGSFVMGGRTWHLDDVPTFTVQYAGDLYKVNFCGQGCNSDIACDSWGGLGLVRNATVSSFADGQLTIKASGGYDYWVCPSGAVSEFVVNCKTDNSPNIEASLWGGCYYYFTIHLPKIYCQV